MKTVDACATLSEDTFPIWGKLSAKRTDEGWTFRGNPFAGNRGIRAPHPALLRAATFPPQGEGFRKVQL